MGGTKALSAVVGAIILLVVLVMFLNKGNLSVGAGPSGTKFGLGYS